MEEEKRIEVNIDPIATRYSVIVINHKQTILLKDYNCYHSKILNANDKYKEIVTPFTLEINSDNTGDNYYICLECLQGELDKIRFKPVKVEKIEIDWEKYDRRFHRGPCKGICPKCNQRAYYLHYPEDNMTLNLAIRRCIKLRKPTYYPIEEVAKDLGIKPKVLCFKCFMEEE